MNNLIGHGNELLINSCADFGLDGFVGRVPHAANKGLNEMAGEVVNQTFVILSNSSGRLTVRASKSATSLSPETLPANLTHQMPNDNGRLIIN